MLPAPSRGSTPRVFAMLALLMAAAATPAGAYQTASCADVGSERCAGPNEEGCATCAVPASGVGDGGDAGEDGDEAAATEGSPWWLLYADASPQDRVLFGMWTYHLRDLSSGAPNNGLIGVVYKGMMAATFITTHGPRGYALGVERAWTSTAVGPTEVMLGYRAGLLHGYDHRLFRLAEISPVIPFLQPVAFVRGGRFTLDVTYTYVVASFTAGFRF